MGSIHGGQKLGCLRARQYDRQTGRSLCPNDSVEPGQFARQDFAIQKQQRTLRLVLHGCGDTPHGREVSQELLDVPCRKLLRMTIVVELDEAPDPIDICLLGADAVMLEQDPRAYLIEQTGSLRLHETAGAIGGANRAELVDTPGKRERW
mgnify:CR=1 FL=1